MISKPSKVISIFGWVGIILGATGSVGLLLSIFGFVFATNIGGVFYFAIAVAYLSTPFVLVTGIGLIRSRSWGRVWGLFVLPIFVGVMVALLLAYIIVCAQNPDMEDPIFFALIALSGNAMIGMLFVLPQMYILTRSNVKERGDSQLVNEPVVIDVG